MKIYRHVLHIILITLLLTIINLNYGSAQPVITLDEKISRADIIASGEVVNISCYWDKNKKRIWTFATIKYDEQLKGQHKESNIVVRILGGKVDDITMEVSGVVKLSLGERVLLFLEKDIENYYAIVEWEHGRFTYKEGKWVNKFSVLNSSFIDQIRSRIK